MKYKRITKKTDIAMQRLVSKIRELNAALKGFFEKTIELKGWKLVWFYFKTLGYHFLWLFIVGVALYLCGARFSQHVAGSSEFRSSFLLLPMCALLEEMLFRWGPMVVFIGGLGYISRVIKIDEGLRSKIENYGIAVIVLASSIVFGLVHGNVFNIALQGVSGLVFFMFYLRRMYRDRVLRKEEILKKADKFQLRPLAASTIYHSLSNTIFVFL